MNNIDFSITSNKSRTKFKIAWTINIGDYPITKVMSREFPTEAAAQEFLDKNIEELSNIIRSKISKMVVSVKEEQPQVKEPTEEVVETIEEVVEETNEPTEEEVETTEEVVEETNEPTEEEQENECTALVPYTAIVPYKKKRTAKIARGIISGILAFIILIIGAHHIAKRANESMGDIDDVPGVTTPLDPDDNQTPETEYTVLNDEEFANLVANLAKKYQDKNINLSVEDITKFVSIINIDALTEENPELAQELFQTSTSIEYINEAAKVISETVMYNGKVFEAEKSTDNFMRISEAMHGEEKAKMLIIESYVDEIAKVYTDSDKVNGLVVELIERLTTGDLQNLDNGTQFGMQISIELIRSYVAKDVLSMENQTALTEITRLNVVEIMETYDNANALTGPSKSLK